MLLGRVVGRLWAARQASGLNGRKLLLVRVEGAGLDQTAPVPDGRGTLIGYAPGRSETSPADSARLVVAVDGLDAGPGDRVIVAHGTRSRDITVGETVPDKDVVIAIVDDYAMDDRGAGRR